MLSKTQAEAIGDDLVDQATAAKHAAVKPVPLIYRCAELRLYEHWQQRELLQQAKRFGFRKNLAVALPCLVWAALCGLFNSWQTSCWFARG